MSKYQYETHLHTKEASACGLRTGKEQARIYKEAGYEGIVVTDHFFNGNSAIPRNLPWEERIDLFYRGYENAKEEGDRIGLSVFFGWESNYNGAEFLIYGLDKDWLKRHPEILSWSVEEQYQRIHEAGGYVIQAHPFRARAYIKEINLYPDFCDAVEGINACNDLEEWNSKAIEYARDNGLPITSGTDSHGVETKRSGIAFSHKINDMKDFMKHLKSGQYELLKYQKIK